MLSLALSLAAMALEKASARLLRAPGRALYGTPFVGTRQLGAGWRGPGRPKMKLSACDKPVETRLNRSYIVHLC